MDDLELLHGDAQQLADFLGVTVRMIKNYKSAKNPLPTAFRKLLKLRLGDLSGLAGDAWEGFSFGRDNKLYLPLWNNGFDPDQIRGLFFSQQEAAALRQDVRRLESELWALKKVHAYTTPEKIAPAQLAKYR